ncbi:unnamed protein product [Parnassius apollo]|uniref:(apollo) hypothetical protein n=1 Tax=Parnassius apollo TaxID=110799 RepID=A0A8S3Y1P9_PARAO|nr:unnamed protein product [Parnassius apollo]
MSILQKLILLEVEELESEVTLHATYISSRFQCALPLACEAQLTVAASLRGTAHCGRMLARHSSQPPLACEAQLTAAASLRGTAHSHR